MFANNYERASYCERLAFTNLCKKHNLFNNYNKYIVNYTDYQGYDNYDVYIHKVNDGTILKRIIIEIKIRDYLDIDNEGYILEDKKVKSLLKMKEIDSDCSILYCVFTKEGTFFWDIDKLILNENIKIENKVMNKATMSSKNNKINKKVYLLKKDTADKYYSYIWDNKQLDEDQLDKNKKNKEIVNNDINKIRDLNFIFDNYKK